MHDCEANRAAMLEYLYDLLEVEQRQALEAGLATCPTCRAELERARRQQGLLAAAARMTFPNVRFVAPEPAEPSATLPLPSPGRRRRTGLRWAIAAGMLLALGIPAAWFGNDHLHARRTADAGKAAVAAARQHLNEAQTQLSRAPQDKARRLAEADHELRAQQLKASAIGPATQPAGARADFRIETRDLNDQPIAAKLKAEVKEGNQVVRTLEAAEIGLGRYRISVPPDLTTKQPSLVFFATRVDGRSQTELREELHLKAPVYMTHLTTDKPMYQPGETVHFRSLTLDRATLRPAQVELRLVYSVQLPQGQQIVVAQGSTGYSTEKNEPKPLIDSQGRAVLGPDGKVATGIGTGDFVLPPEAKGGEWVLSVREENGLFPEQQRKFLVNEYQKPRFDKKLDFNRSSYGPGDEVQALCTAKAAGGLPLKDCPVMASVLIDGQAYGADGNPSPQPLTFKTDAAGAVTVRFKLPARIERGQASLTVRFQEEPLVRTIPLVLKKLDVEFFPEGGYLVSGLPNRVYFQVRTPLGKPADLKGRLLEDGKPLDVAVETVHNDTEPGVNQGMGSFAFTPKPRHKYELQIERPTGVEGRKALPEPEADKTVVLHVKDAVVDAGKPIEVVLYSAQKRSLMVGAYVRGQLLDSARVEPIHFNGNAARVLLTPAEGSGGVCRVTVFEAIPGGGERQELRPVAERLIYRRPVERLDVKLTTDRTAYVPRQEVKLGVQTWTEKQEAAPALAMLAVVDKSVITMADEKTARTMPTHFFLTTEVRRSEDLEYADFFLGSHPRAAEALDLLLGTQGWRRFAEQDPAKFREKHADEAERLLVLNFQSTEKATDFAERRRAEVEKESDAQEKELQQQLAEARQGVQNSEKDPQYLAALATLHGYEDFFDGMRRWSGPAAAVLLAGAALACLVLAARRGWRRAVAYWGCAAACWAALVLVLLQLDRKPQEVGGRDKGQVALAEHAAEEPLADKLDQEKPNNEPAAPKMAEQRGLGHGKPGGWAAPGVAPAPAAAMPPRAPTAATLPADKGKGDGSVRRGGEPDADGKDLRLRDDANAQLGAERTRQHAARQLGVDKEVPRFAMPTNGATLAKKAEGGMDLAEKRPIGGPAAMGGYAAPAGAGGLRGGGGALPFEPEMLEEKQREQLFRRDLAKDRAPKLAPLPPLVVREYAHNPPAPADPTQRIDYTETVFWHPVLVLPGGKAEVAFRLCDSATSFQATAFVHTLDGRLGAATHLIESRLPLALKPRTPIEVTASDRIEVPVAVTNNTDRPAAVSLTLTGTENLESVGMLQTGVQVAPQSTARKFFLMRPRLQEGQASVSFRASGDSLPDGATERFRIVPEGFPVVVAKSDVLEKSATQIIDMPASWVKGTLQCQVSVYPSTLADLQKGLEALLREPCGCFEQTSTSNYPNLLILDYLKESDQARPEVERRARELLARGYDKLTSFECTNPKNGREGYEWFGGTAPAHEALTAYGLMEFRDMARVHPVDPAMVERTRNYLLSRKDGNGGFQRNPRALDTFGAAPEDITNAYIVWAITEGGRDENVARELAKLVEQAQTSKDPYFLSLVANSLINRARTEEAVVLLKKVAAEQKADGHLDAEKTSITHSGGRDLQIETTALAVLGWLKANPGTFQQPVQKAIRWIGQQRGGYGGFGSTQSTILALKALIAYTRANKTTAEPGTLELFVNDKPVSRLAFAAGASDALTLTVPDAEKRLQPGKNKVRVEVAGKNVFPYTLTCSYQTLQPASAADCPVRLATKLAKTEGTEGESVRLTVQVANASGQGQGMAVAIIGLPGGLALPEDLKQLKDYKRIPDDGSRPLISAFEVRGRELVLYWRDLAPEQKIEVPLDLVCRVPGTYSGPASRAYLYYNADRKHWVEPLKMTITPRP
jgi:hypothetical protein